jgi:hypothetical protein
MNNAPQYDDMDCIDAIHNAGFAQELSTCTVNTMVGSTLIDVFATMADT